MSVRWKIVKDNWLCKQNYKSVHLTLFKSYICKEMKWNECITLSTFKILPVQLSIKKLNISKKVCLLSNMSTNTFCQLFLHWLSFMKKIVICRLFKYRPRLTEYKWLQIEICIILSNLFFHFFVYILFSFCMLWSKFQTFSHLKFVTTIHDKI